MQSLDREFPTARSAFDLDHGIEGGQGDAEVGGVGGDALLGPAENGMKAVFALQRIAAGAGFPPVAGARSVLEIGAARSLQQIAPDRRGIAQLRGGP